MLTRVVCWFVLFSTVGGLSSSHGQTVFHYQGINKNGKQLPVIPDASPAANDGLADPQTKYSSSVPFVGVPSTAGNRSFNGQDLGGVSSGGTQELSNQAIADAGGFTMEAWFVWAGAGAVNSIIDYAGTEKLVIDAQVAPNELRMRINSDANLDSLIGSVSADEWYYTAAVFDTQGNTVDAGSISGVFHLYLNDQLVRTTDTLTITDFGDSLDRSIGVGKHPLGFAGDHFNGLIFDPRVSLGALTQDQLMFAVPEPSSIALCALGIIIAIARTRALEPISN